MPAAIIPGAKRKNIIQKSTCDIMVASSAVYYAVYGTAFSKNEVLKRRVAQTTSTKTDTNVWKDVGGKSLM